MPRGRAGDAVVIASDLCYRGSDGDPVDAVFVNVAGNAGIGTLKPLAGLHVAKTGPIGAVFSLLDVEIDGDAFERLEGANSVYISGTTGYVTASPDNALTIIDVTDPKNPALLSEVFEGDGEFSLLNFATAVFVSGSTAFVASRLSDSITSIDVSDPRNPTLLVEVAVAGGKASRAW